MPLSKRSSRIDDGREPCRFRPRLRTHPEGQQNPATWLALAPREVRRPKSQTDLSRGSYAGGFCPHPTVYCFVAGNTDAHLSGADNGRQSPKGCVSSATGGISLLCCCDGFSTQHSWHQRSKVCLLQLQDQLTTLYADLCPDRRWVVNAGCTLTSHQHTSTADTVEQPTSEKAASWRRKMQSPGLSGGRALPRQACVQLRGKLAQLNDHGLRLLI